MTLLPTTYADLVVPDKHLERQFDELLIEKLEDAAGVLELDAEPSQAPSYSDRFAFNRAADHLRSKAAQIRRTLRGPE